jgi:hypothetical protein
MGANTARRKTRNILEKVPSFKSISRKYCPPGQILRKAYTRRYTTAVRKRGFTVKKSSGKEYRIHPEQKNMYVEARCIKDRGLPGKGPKSGKGIGPLRKGELSSYGYSFRSSNSQRHEALRKAVDEYSALSVFHKLDAIAKLTLRTAPKAHKVFAEDREWVSDKFGPLKAPV